MIVRTMMVVAIVFMMTVMMIMMGGVHGTQPLFPAVWVHKMFSIEITRQKIKASTYPAGNETALYPWGLLGFLGRW